MLNDRIIQMCFALGNTERMIIMDALKDHPRSVTDLLKDMKVTQSTLSHHLRILRKAGFVSGIRSGRHVYYAERKGNFDNLTEILKEYNDAIPTSAMILLEDNEE